MFDKWKSKNALCKAYRLYYKKKMSYLKADTIDDLYYQLEDIQYAIAYVLCESFDFNYQFYYDYFPFSYKWFIAYDYIRYYDECKKAYEKITQQNKTKHNNVVNKNKGNYSKGDIIFTKSGRLYYYDGKNFENMC